MDRRFGAKFIVAAAVVVVVLAALFVIFTTVLKPNLTIDVNGKSFSAKLISKKVDRMKYLDGGVDVGSDIVLVAFLEDGNYSISMKDNAQTLDVLWLDGEQQVVQMAKNAKPSSGVNDRYRPKKNIRYILTAPSGFVDSNKIKLSQAIDFDLAGNVID